jgi:hypothetical protein
MGRLRGASSVSLAVLAAAQLLYTPLGHAQEPQAEPEPPPPAVPPPRPRGQVQDQDEPGQAPNVAPQPQYPPQYPPQYAPPPPVYGPTVTLRADNPRARLQVMGPLKWQDICVAPCNVHVHPAGSYRIAGGSIRASETFTMPRQSGPVLIEAEVGSKVKHGVGVGLTIGGAIAALAGGIYLVAASSASDGFTNNKQALQGVGIIYLVVGAVLLVIGLPLSTSSTYVRVR